MATIMKQEAAETREQPPVRRELPRITRQIHTPITSLSRCAEHIRLRSESAYSSAAQADLATLVIRNVQEVMPEGSASLPSRFLRMLER